MILLTLKKLLCKLLFEAVFNKFTADIHHEPHRKGMLRYKAFFTL